MAIENKEFTMYQKENKSLIFPIVDSSGVNKVLTGGSAIFVIIGLTVKVSKINGNGIVIDGNKITVLLEENDTADLVGTHRYELRATDTDGSSEVVATGRINIVKSATASV